MSDETGARQVGAPDGNLVLDLFVLDQRMGALLDAALGPTGVRPAEYAVYSQLGAGPLTPTQLCDRLGVSRSTMTGHLAALQRRGDTERVPDPRDGRSYRVELTASGRERLEACRPHFRAALARLVHHLGGDTTAHREMVRAVDAAAARAIADLLHESAEPR
ncbi:MarR family transcriptional regulator [Intrasporangium oryzae NRRL B-24470]|uniref:MarR family transcriptional regulator n=1 Tax=Intrasporangium oryzae NRRL B-24470 TaxID=1386089 RepID=W9GDT4_9MICO|nr:MarR family transcriptional regulator [Intrasporangium oryzae]EWT01994.1 MarR family transcriptional regulator [Intrasporangium oryzae NRRL B-24470]